MAAVSIAFFKLDQAAHNQAILILILFQSGQGILSGIYFGASRASFQIEAQKSAIGFTAFQVISFDWRAAITAIQRITRARTFIIIVDIIHFHISRAVLIPEVVSFVRTHTVLNVTAVGSFQNTKVWVCVSLLVVIFTLSHFIAHVASLFQLRALIVALRKTSQKDKAADTYTGTKAKDINFCIVMCFSNFLKPSHHLPVKNHVRAKSGENIAYNQSITALLNKA
ncbi:MAG: hypothetical protein ACD_49C00073G0001 [uncultured bacterium (gcode 4)]|uniref:Uncharacterized protein n=1 Tax=uncultured bacterium (gcode 4) TaxID=1234023 RepID=K2BB18_9BACT|nr:MAG: hypothetical protein ACD_49C00073G0001 [uncultured bacterium (gcode 4)]